MALQLGVTAIFGMFCFINLLNCIDRGIIPGAPIQFQAFIQKTHNVDSSNVSVYLGLLQSIFIASYSVFICVFGYLSMTRKPFLLMAVSLSVWILSIVMCGVAKPAESFYLLLFGRLLSGVGEASFHATAPPFIDEFAPPAKRTLWLGFYYATFSIGQALGFSYGSLTARTVGWDYGFYLTALLMVPVVYLCHRCIPNHLNLPLGQKKVDIEEELMPSITTPRSSFLHETWYICKNPAFMTSALGLAAYTFTIQGMVAFAPAILIGYGLLSESIASTAFGGIVVLAGLIGSPISGLVLDKVCRGHDGDRFFRLHRAALQMFVSIAVGVALLLVSLAVMNSKILFLGLVFLGFLGVFATQTVTSIVVMSSVTDAQRGYAMGLSTFIQHLFGDVPAAVILGALKDMWAPNCGSSVDPVTHKDVLNPNCYLDKDGLRYTLAFAYGWLLWAVLLWGMTYLIGRKWHRQQSEVSSKLEANE
ncbi:Major Facilitator Superfamily (MFS) [Achlya hypogyna]|uniref:Major Facilitator Superfamily (MFS) n=1 Tax=Achlya hypogyna TaxID=1202772 RepID=A0A1V9Y4G3_ACHHY|nr:Major Facilitator Superfamily (MFS) [Achlya hypogyna]